MDEIVFEPSDVNMLAALGIVESVKLFPFMLSMGELQYACDSEYRCKQFVNCLSEYYPDSQIEARQLWSKYHGTANAVQCDMINHKPLRVWAFIIFVTMQQSMVQIEFCLHPEKV